MSIMQIITLVGSVVGLVERIFSGRRRAGRAKKARAVRLLAKAIRVDAKVSPELARLIASLVDVLGPMASDSLHDNKAYRDLMRAWDIITDAVHTVALHIEDPGELRDEIVAFVNTEIDLPMVDEGVESMVIGLMTDHAVLAWKKSGVVHHEF